MQVTSLEDYLRIPENSTSLEAFKVAFKLRFPKLEFEKCTLKLLDEENISFILSGEGDALKVNDLFREFFPAKLKGSRFDFIIPLKRKYGRA